MTHTYATAATQHVQAGATRGAGGSSETKNWRRPSLPFWPIPGQRFWT